jgi:hypothetical protein
MLFEGAAGSRRRRRRCGAAVSGLAADGRWKGAVTQRPLPEIDDEIRELPQVEREFIAHLWWSQAATEGRVAHSFAVVRDALTRLVPASTGADAEITALAARAVDDEHRHAALCMQMATRYLGAHVAPALELPFSHPTHPTARSPRVRDALYVIGQCVFNETLASAYLSASLDAAGHPLARSALRELLSDEIDHARIGWAYLGALPKDLHRDVVDWLPALAIANLREWRKLTLPTANTSLERHGFLQKDRIEEALLHAMRDLIVPGIAHVGFGSVALERWATNGAATANFS